MKFKRTGLKAPEEGIDPIQDIESLIVRTSILGLRQAPCYIPATHPMLLQENMSL